MIPISTLHLQEGGARRVAADHLIRVEQHGAFVGRIGLPSDLDARDRRLITDLVAGVTRWRRWLDFVVERSARRSVDQLEPLLRQIVRIGAYEILERVTPDYAAVNEAVNLAKAAVRPGAGKLVNAVLRRVVAVQDALPRPDGSPAEKLAIRQSHPDWMVRRWYERYGEAGTASLLAWNNRRPDYALRLNLARIDAQRLVEQLGALGVGVTPSSFLDDFVRVDSLQIVLDEGMVAQGLVAVQDEAAGLVVRVLDPHPGQTIVDACAAPGGKLAYCCAKMHDSGHLIAVDANASRLGRARHGAETLGCFNVQYHAADATNLEAVLGDLQPDKVLIDAPCSGLGVMAKRPDLRWRREMADILELAGLQDRLLDAAAAVIRPGGLVVYSTCTIEPEENEERVTAFLRRQPRFEVESVAPFVSGEVVTDQGYYAALPHVHGIDGAFAVRLRNRN